jgi:hypothetical protein
MKRRSFLKFLTAALLLPRPTWALGEEDYFRVAVLKYPESSFSTRSKAISRLLYEVEKQTSIRVDSKPLEISATDKELFLHPFLIWMGESGFEPFSDEAVLQLRRYVQAGGFIFVDSAEGVLDGPFMRSVKRELERILPQKKLTRLPSDHVVYKAFFLIDKPVGRLAIEDHLLGVFETDRVSVLVSNNDVVGAWARDNFGNWLYPVSPGGERQRTMAMRLGINLVMYALCINYKADQVHVPFILKRRRWRVD